MAKYFKPKKTLVNATAVFAVLIALFMVSTSAVSAIENISSEMTTMSESVEEFYYSENAADLDSANEVYTGQTPTGDLIFRQTFQRVWQNDYEGEKAPRASGAFGDVPTTQFWEAIQNNYDYNYYGEPMFWHRGQMCSCVIDDVDDYAACIGQDEDFCDGVVDQDEWIFTPPIELEAESVLYLDTCVGGGWAHDYILVSTDDGCSWTTLVDFYNYPAGCYLDEAIDLSDYTGMTIRIAFNRVMDTTDFGVTHVDPWCVDDVEIREVDVHDVGVSAIVEPVGGIAGHGAGRIENCDELVMDVIVEVTNYGIADEFDFNVSVVIDDLTAPAPAFYDEFLTIDLAAGETVTLTFPTWSPPEWQNVELVTIDYQITACTELGIPAGPVDENPANDCMVELFSLEFPCFHDVGVSEILAPVDGLATCVEPQVVLYNYGQFSECCFPVTITIEEDPGWLTWYFEDFEHGIPDGWDQEYYGHGDDCVPAWWELVPEGYLGPYDPSIGNFMVADSDGNPHSLFDTGLFTQTFNFTDLIADGVTLIDITWLFTYITYGGSGDTFMVLEHDGPITTVISDFGWVEGVLPPGGASGWWNELDGYTLDITALAHPENFTLEFYYYTGDVWSWYAAIDDLTISIPMEGAGVVYEDEVCIVGDLCVGEEQTVTFEEFCPDELEDPSVNYDIEYLVTAESHLCYPPDCDNGNDAAIATALYDFRHDVAVLSLDEPGYYPVGAQTIGYADDVYGGSIGLTSPGDVYWGIVIDNLNAGDEIDEISVTLGDDVIAAVTGEVFIADATTGSWIMSEPYTSAAGEFTVSLSTSYFSDGEPIVIGAMAPCDGVIHPAAYSDTGYVEGKSFQIGFDADPTGWDDLSADYGFDPGAWMIKANMIPSKVFYLGNSVKDIAATLGNLGVYDEETEVTITIVDEAMTTVYDEMATVTIPALSELQVTMPTWTPTAAGTYTLDISAYIPIDEDLGNNVLTGIKLVIDIEDPVSTATVIPGDPNGDNDWYTTDVTVLLEATDDNAVDAIYYSLDGGATTEYTGLIVVDDDGEHSVEFWAVDAAGNTEEPKTVSFKIDQTNPTISVDYEVTDDGGLFGDPVIEVTATASDATSGVDRIEWSTGETGTSITINAAFTVSATVFDEAGNFATDSVTPESAENTNL